MSDEERRDIWVRARFERFPATVKGAFVIRGEDANPHQVAFREARLVQVGGSEPTPIPLKEAILHAPPHQDVFLPFEFPITDLAPGWWGLEADMDVDGSARTFPGGRTFVVPWPRSAVRRGTQQVDQTLSADNGATVHLQGFDLSSDHALLRYSVDPPKPVSIRVFAGDVPLGELENDFDEQTGAGRLKVYPLLREHQLVRVRIDGSPAEAQTGLP